MELEDEEFSNEETIALLERFETKGFWFFPAWTMDKPYSPDRIKLPSGKIEDIKELIRNKDALAYYDLIRTLDCDTRYNRYLQSFIDNQDIKNISEKNYSKFECLI
ncbi:MAG: hypothetical protein Q7S33_00025 [Nanoarchaeota archaeon]|nr:hypothetical protein [Nanoarchaeota archaeon]